MIQCPTGFGLLRKDDIGEFYDRSNRFPPKDVRYSTDILTERWPDSVPDFIQMKRPEREAGLRVQMASEHVLSLNIRMPPMLASNNSSNPEQTDGSAQDGSAPGRLPD